jgi:hypothetical protein
MKLAYNVAFTLSIASVCMVAGCHHKYANTEQPASLRTPAMSHRLPGDYKTETQEFLARLKNGGKLEDLKAWAKQLLQTHLNDDSTFTVPHSEVPDFILKLDPPLEPSMVMVVPKSHVTIAWGGGFGWWGLFLSDHDIVLDNPTVYVIKWAPGVEVFHDIQ